MWVQLGSNKIISFHYLVIICKYFHTLFTDRLSTHVDIYTSSYLFWNQSSYSVFESREFFTNLLFMCVPAFSFSFIFFLTTWKAEREKWEGDGDLCSIIHSPNSSQARTRPAQEPAAASGSPTWGAGCLFHRSPRSLGTWVRASETTTGTHTGCWYWTQRKPKA